MAPARTVDEWLARTCRDHPAQLALRVGGGDFTYEDLDVASTRAASDILDFGLGWPRRVGVIASRTFGTYVAYAATLRLGATVVPLNRDFPLNRNASIVQAAGLDLLVCAAQDSDVAAALGAATGLRWLALPAEHELLARENRRLAGRVGPPGTGADDRADDLAYILFTSGSTGTPKGVPIKHSCVSAYLVHNIPYFQAGPGARITQTSDLTFDLSGFALFVAWGSGAAIVVPGKTDLLEPARHVQENQISHWLSVPSVVSLAHQLQNLPPDSMPTLRWSLFVGEQLTTEQASAWREAAPGSTLENLYGPTEVTISCTSYRLPAQPAAWPVVNGTVPIGRPYPEVECVVVDDDGVESRDGELLLRGAQRFDGYLDPALNRGRFARWDGGRYQPYDGVAELTAEDWYRTGDRVRVEHGELFHLGRLDNQVKVRGYRIEPGDIEAALREHPSVDQAVVVPCVADDGVDLAAAYTGAPVGRDELAELVKSRLPDYMVPEFFVWMGTLPLTVNGKVDRARLTAETLTWTGA
jgi:amino acid adenylation domain-containing protein